MSVSIMYIVVSQRGQYRPNGAIKRSRTIVNNRRGGDGHWRDTLRGATDWKRMRNADVHVVVSFKIKNSRDSER